MRSEEGITTFTFLLSSLAEGFDASEGDSIITQFSETHDGISADAIASYEIGGIT